MSLYEQRPLNAAAVHLAGCQYVADVQAHALAFMFQRLGENLATGVELLDCQSAARLSEIRGHYFGTAFEQYCAATAQQIRLGRAMCNGIATRDP